ncbi:MAG TPA: class I SAM-dependent methyltransferase [Candidatus Binatia bacterium]|nr:class I SAM-dependent methyltransferase [Candidatus Binatia bacterium]
MANDNPTDELLAEQTEYYRTRGALSDDWFYRRGRYDHGHIINRQWFAEGIELVQAILNFGVRGKVLELGGGSGYWTQHLVLGADQVTVLEISPESIEASRVRLGPLARKVKFVEVDFYQWHPTERYDVVFFAFWLTHVPPDRFEKFWSFVRSLLTPRGRVFLIDNVYSRHGTAKGHLPNDGGFTATRNRGGREHRVYKTFYTREELGDRLHQLGWQSDLYSTREFFLYGSTTRAD